MAVLVVLVLGSDGVKTALEHRNRMGRYCFWSMIKTMWKELRSQGESTGRKALTGKITPTSVLKIAREKRIPLELRTDMSIEGNRSVSQMMMMMMMVMMVKMMILMMARTKRN
ncbi:hypothetical protein PoB_001347100 [Plakobranchus ocellatus]|uniref:Uncharacterized protein n=1 Tax=Plakobranchus ocellatus TaxID=259542 RepID=A0AAV3YX51_9GAST|nr:hypothetical protein PoB_001347100 [Plakobranchus ocellatus]